MKPERLAKNEGRKMEHKLCRDDIALAHDLYCGTLDLKTCH